MHNPRGVRPQSKTVLLVDDEPDILNLLGATFDENGHPWAKAQDGAEALELFREIHADIVLIVTDFHMPHMNGLTFVQKAREIAPGVKVIVASAGMDRADFQKLGDLGATTFIQKPFTTAEMTACYEGFASEGAERSVV